jgi:anti-sigma factor RsiW
MSGTRMPTPDAGHATHDLTLVAARSTREPALSTTEAAAADALLAACTECADLYADLVALASALPTAAAPRRTRDFTLTAADAERLRPRGIRAWLARIGSPRDTLSKPLAIGFTTLGLAGLLVATAPSVLTGGAGGAALAPAEAAPSAAPASVAENLAMSAAPSASPVDDGNVFNGSDSSDPARATTAPGDGPSIATPSDEVAVRDDASGWSILVVIAGSMLILGLGLFALRWSARRFGD